MATGFVRVASIGGVVGLQLAAEGDRKSGETGTFARVQLIYNDGHTGKYATARKCCRS